MDYALKGRAEYRGYPLLLFSTAQGGGSDQPHRHDFVEIALVRSGFATHCVYDNNGSIIQKETLIRGDLYIIPPGVTHQFQNKHDVKLYTMAFLPELLTPEEVAVLKMMPVFRQLYSGVPETPRIHLLPLEFAGMEAILQKVMSELSCLRDHALHHLLAKSLVLEYLIAVGTHAEERWSHAPEDADRMIMQAISDMERHPEKHWQLSELARRYGMCASGFGRKFREVTGVPPLKYCRLLRLEQVRKELMTTGESVENLAEKFGFADSNHLIKLFRKHYGTTPLNFRKMPGNIR